MFHMLFAEGDVCEIYKDFFGFNRDCRMCNLGSLYWLNVYYPEKQEHFYCDKTSQFVAQNKDLHFLARC